MCVYVCVCKCEREWMGEEFERERDTIITIQMSAKELSMVRVIHHSYYALL